jgi:15-cis-phytoene desaturase
MNNKPFDAIIVGAGLAGLSCGLNLLDQGLSVLILEAREIPGGRTASWDDDGMQVESGLHRYLGFYEALPDLMKRAGVDINDIVIWTDEAEIRLPDGGGAAVFGLSPVHNLLETLWGVLANNSFIDPLEKAKLSAFFTKGMVTFETDPQALDAYTVEELALKEGLSPETIHKILVPLTEGIFFLPVERYSALNLFGLFAPYLTKMHKMRVGSFSGGMSEVMIAPLVDWITAHGGEIRTDAPVERLLVENDQVTGVLCNGEEIRSTAVVVAASLVPAQELFEGRFPDHPFFTTLGTLESMPSVCVELELSRPSSPHDRVIFAPGTVLASFAEEGRTTFPASAGRLSTILAHPAQAIKLSDEELLTAVLRDAQRLGLDVSAETVLDYRVITWPHDFYSYERGTYNKRPPQKTPVPGLFLAGDYTRQEYLQTMEGAVVSGKLAAEAVLEDKKERSAAV